MEKILGRLINQESISEEEAKRLLVNISKGIYNPSQVAAFLTVYMMRNITLHELKGFRDALLEMCIPVEISEYNAIDLCGTGGDGKNTFNISTLASFITAAAGVNVAKHGNYGVSSASGSSNVLEYFGIKFSNDINFIRECLDTAGICILHAPLFHPAMKNVAPIRKELGVKTFFNMLGPMVNPSFPKNQMVGVFSLELLRLYGYLYENTNKNFSIVHALDGYDEISLTGDTKVISNTSEYILSPEDFGLERISMDSIYGGESLKDAADLFMSVLNGTASKIQHHVVCANAAVAIATAKQIDLEDGYELAKEALFSGEAKQRFNSLKKLSERK